MKKEIPCYCDLWEKDPDFFQKQGIPQGYCGMCQVCRKPGHIRHYPGSVPYTGSWCDECYENLSNSISLSDIISVIFRIILIGIIVISIYKIFF